MANKSMSVLNVGGEDYTINDPNIANEFSASTNYEKGDFVYYKGTLYKFLANHSAGSWNTSDVQVVKVGSTMFGLRNDIDSAQNDIDTIAQTKNDFVLCESGSFYDDNGAIKQNSVPARIRNAYPIAVSEYSAIVVPFDYEMWVFRLDKTGTYISNAGSWKKGKQNIKDIITKETRYINIAIRNVTAPTSDISANVGYVQNNLILERDTMLKGEKDITNNYDVSIGQAYGTVGNEIIESEGLAYRHLKILKSQGIKKVVFSTTITSGDVSSYIQYVNDSNIIIALDVINGHFEQGAVYNYYPVFPEGATGMYVTAGFKNNANDWDLRVYKDDEISSVDMIDAISEKEAIYDRIVKSVNRIANGVGNYPRQSIVGFKAAYKIGFRAMLCDLRWTADNVPVLEHDELLNGYYHDVYTSSGELVSTDPGVYIANTDYADLLAYDFGLYKGTEYKGTKIMTFEQMLDLCKRLGCEVHIETKTELTETQYGIAFGLIRLYGMERQCVWNPQSLVQLASLVAYEPNVYINLHTNLSSGSALSDSAVTAICDTVNDYNRGHVSLTVSLGATMTEAQAKTLSAAGVGVMGTTLNTEAQVLEYYNQGKPYTCITSVLSDGVIAGKVLLHNTI